MYALVLNFPSKKVCPTIIMVFDTSLNQRCLLLGFNISKKTSPEQGDQRLYFDNMIQSHAFLTVMFMMHSHWERRPCCQLVLLCLFLCWFCCLFGLWCFLCRWLGLCFDLQCILKLSMLKIQEKFLSVIG